MITLQERVHGVKPPQEWPLNKLHHIFMVRRGNKNVDMLNNNLLSLSYGKIIKKNINTSEGLLPESFETYQIVEPGDIVMRLTDLQNDKRSLRQGLVKEKGIITSAYDAIFPAYGHDSRYWAYALLAMDLAKYYYSLGGGVRQSIKFKDFPNDWIHTPLTKNQKEIADFLDREIDRIDQLIEKKELFLSKTFQRWELVLHEAITGKNYTGERKDSQIRWIGSIPAYWKLWSVRYLTKEHRQGYYTTESYTDDGLPLARITDLLSFGRISFNSAPKVRKIPQTKEFLLKKGDFLFARTGGAGLFGIVENEEINAVYASYLIRFRFSEICNHNFMKYYFLSRCFLDGVEESVHGGVNQNIHAENIKSQKIALPPVSEQKAICAALELEQLKIEKLKSLIDDSVSKLKELRTSLITEAVTGQLDIRAWKKGGGTDKRLDNIEEAMRS